jgi:hypothetical protein
VNSDLAVEALRQHGRRNEESQEGELHGGRECTAPPILSMEIAILRATGPYFMARYSCGRPMKPQLSGRRDPVPRPTGH